MSGVTKTVSEIQILSFFHSRLAVVLHNIVSAVVLLVQVQRVVQNNWKDRLLHWLAALHIILWSFIGRNHLMQLTL